MNKEYYVSTLKKTSSENINVEKYWMSQILTLRLENLKKRK